MTLREFGMSFATMMLLAVLIGLTVVKVVEARMTDISINMPTIKFPQQRITVQVQEPPVSGAAPALVQKKGTVVYNSLDTLRSGQVGGDGSNEGKEGKEGMVCKKTLPEARTHFDAEKYRSQSKAMPKPTAQAAPLPSQSARAGAYAAPYPRPTPVLTEPTPTAGKTYYKDPKDMTADQLAKFQQRAKFENMTVQDYQNWLLTFKDNPGRLTGFHRGNLKVLVRGGQLDQHDLPQRTRVPDSSLDQYTQILHGQMPLSNIPHPEYLGYQPHNFEQQIGQPTTNRDLRHLDYVNPDEPLKTWILTHTKPEPERSKS